MLSKFRGLRLIGVAVLAASLAACRTFSPDGGMMAVASVAGGGLGKSVVKVDSPEEAAAAKARVQGLLRSPLSADAAVQIALLNNLGLQAAYNRLGIAEALAVKASRPPAIGVSFSTVSTPVELDIERQIMASLLSLLTMPARTRIASDEFAQAELEAAEETLRVAAQTRAAYLRAVAARESVSAIAEAKGSADASAELAGHLQQTGAMNKLDQARRQVFATEMSAELLAAQQQADATAEQLTRLMGLWQAKVAAYLPGSLPALPAGLRARGAIEQQALDTRIDVQIARAEMDSLAKSYGLTRKTHFLNVLDASGISKAQKDRGEKRADGGGYQLALEVPLFDFGRANVREAEQRYLKAANGLGQIGINAASEAREAYSAYRATYTIAKKYQSEVMPLQQIISNETVLQYNAMQVDAFVLLDASRATAKARVASIEAKRNFWMAATNLSVAVLGGGPFPAEPGSVITASASAGGNE